MQCPNCGKQVSGDIKFCPQCGQRITTFAPGEGQKHISRPNIQAPAKKQPTNKQQTRKEEERYCNVCGKKLGLWTPGGQIEGKSYCENCGNDIVWHCAMCRQEKRGIAPINKGELSFCSTNCAAKYNELWLNELREGRLTGKVAGEKPPIVLKQQEELKVVLPNMSLLEPRAIRKSSGLYGGPTIRVTKGVSFRLGGAQGRGESHEELRNIDKGVLTLTNQRLVFSGEKRTLNIDLAKIISIQPFKDGIAIRREGKEKTQYFSVINPKMISIKMKVGDGEYEEPFTGTILKCLIEGAIKQQAQLPPPEKAKLKSTSTDGKSISDLIRELADLRDAGILTSEEFESKKAELLKRI